MNYRPPTGAPSPHVEPMPAPEWTPARAALLLSLREAMRLDESVFAKRHAIAVAQLRALEGRGQTPFYSEAIKARLGERLLASLGHPHQALDDRMPEAPPRSEEASTPDSSAGVAHHKEAQTNLRTGWRRASHPLMIGLAAVLAALAILIVLQPPAG